MTDRELMQQALEALTAYDGTNGASQRKRVLAALRDRLAQPNDFNPDWDAMAVMVEEQQRMAKRIAELEAQPERIQLTVRDFVVTVGDIEDAVGTPMYWAEWPNREQP